MRLCLLETTLELMPRVCLLLVGISSDKSHVSKGCAWLSCVVSQ